MLACLFYFTCEAAGASSTRHSLRPLLGGLKEISWQTSGASRGENAESWLFGNRIPSCHHPRMRVIQYSEAPVIESKSCGVLDTRMRGYDGHVWTSARNDVFGCLTSESANAGERSV